MLKDIRRFLVNCRARDGSEGIGEGRYGAAFIGFAEAVAVGVEPAPVQRQSVGQLAFDAGIPGGIVRAAVGVAVGQADGGLGLGIQSEAALNLDPPGLRYRF